VRGCCTYTVGDGINSFGVFTTIQKAIDALPSGGEVCILPGEYKENIHIVNCSDICIHGCGDETVLNDSGGAAAPVILIQDSQDIEIRSLAINAPAVIGIQMISTSGAEKNNAGLNDISLTGLAIASRDVSAIDCRGGSGIRIERNEIFAEPLAVTLNNSAILGKAPLVFVRADDVLIERNELVADAQQRLNLPMGGLQIGGGSERVAIRRNLIQGGNGNGITFGSLTYTLSAPGGPAGQGPGTVLFPYFGYTIGSNGCLVPDPDPQDPTGPTGKPLTPVSDGDLLDIRVIDNEVLDMGLCGISTLRYFKTIPVIQIRNLDVDSNNIRGCMQMELGDNPFGNATVQIAFGGITLVSVEMFTLRNNWIVANGRSFIDPICGVFVANVRGFVAEGNQILDNGPRVDTAKQPTAGPRAGIGILLAKVPLTPPGETPGALLGFPAAKIDGNVVTSPYGRALGMVAFGPTAIRGNEFTSRGIESGLGLWGSAVLVFNLGITYEVLQFAGFANMGVNQSSPAAQGTSLLPGGLTLFDDNQVLPAPLDQNNLIVLSSILILAPDDVQFNSNQSECRMLGQSLATNATIFGWSTRTTSNRFVETFLAGVSAFTIAVMNTTTMNQGTRCFAIAGAPNVTIKTGNRSFLAYLGGNQSADPCASFDGRFTAVMAKFGLNGE